MGREEGSEAVSERASTTEDTIVRLQSLLSRAFPRLTPYFYQHTHSQGLECPKCEETERLRDEIMEALR